MGLLLDYLKNHKWIVTLALLLAGFNIGFSLLDPYITGRILDRFINQKDKLTYAQYLWGSLGLIGLAIGAAMVSRIAKNFQDYFTSVIVQKVGAKMYADGLQHSLKLPYQVFEDQRTEIKIARSRCKNGDQFAGRDTFRKYPCDTGPALGAGTRATGRNSGRVR